MLLAKQYKSDYKELVFEKEIKIPTIAKREIAKRISNAVTKLHPLIELLGKIINVKRLKDTPESYSNFLSTKRIIILICLFSAT